MQFPRQEYWSELPFPTSGNLPDPGILCLLHWQAYSLLLRHLEAHVFGHRPVWMLPWRYFLDEINTWISRPWEKQITLHNVDGPHAIFLRPSEIIAKVSSGRKESCLQTVLRLSCIASYSLSPQPAGLPCRFGTCQPPQWHEPVPKISLSLCTHTCPTGSVSVRTLTTRITCFHGHRTASHTLETDGTTFPVSPWTCFLSPLLRTLICKDDLIQRTVGDFMLKQEATSSWYFIWYPTVVKYGCISLGNVTRPSARLCTSRDIRAAVCWLWELCIPVCRNHGDEMSSDQEQRWAPENTCEEEAAAEELLGGKSDGDWRHRQKLMHSLLRARKIWSQLKNKFRPRTEGRRKYSLLPSWSGELGWWSYSNVFTLSLFFNFFYMSVSSLYSEKNIYLQPWKKMLSSSLVTQHTWSSYFLFFSLLSSFSLEGCVCVWVWKWVCFGGRRTWIGIGRRRQ